MSEGCNRYWKGELMSSTNRSKAREEHIADYYRTPIKDIEIFFSALDNEISIDMDKCTLDPCAGGDSNNPMSYPVAIHNYYKVPQGNIKTIDIRKDSLADIKGNYLMMKLDYTPYVIITNPPYNCAIDFIKKALNDVEENGYVIMLLRLNFLETKTRKEFFDNYMPEYIFVHHKRMSFIEGGGTDSVAYAHYVWRKGYYPEFSKIKVI